MNHTLVIVLFVLFSFGNTSEPEILSTQTRLSVSSDTLKIFDFDGLQKFLSEKDQKKTYVINFWATWCAPCVKELPYFEQLNAKYTQKGVEVILVSLDFPKQIETKVAPFIAKQGLKSEVVVLDDVDSNTWIPKVNEDWSGAIPATLIYNKNKSKFYERSFNFQELETELKPFINK